MSRRRVRRSLPARQPPVGKDTETPNQSLLPLNPRIASENAKCRSGGMGKRLQLGTREVRVISRGRA